jgi:hypothetical protein
MPERREQQRIIVRWEEVRVVLVVVVVPFCGVDSEVEDEAGAGYVY